MKRMVLIPEEKLLQYEQQQKSPVSHVAEDKQYEEKEHDVQDILGEERKELSDDIIVRGIPKTMRTRAIALLERLKARPDVISWDDMGQVKIDGVLIPKSNISDLVSSAMRSRKYFDPIASQEFFNVLSNLNVPKDLVRNEEGWRKVTQKGKGKIFSDDFWKQVLETKRLMRTTARAGIYKGGGQKGKGGLISPGAWYQMGETSQRGIGKRKKPEEGYTQKGKGELSDDFSEAWYHLERTPWKRILQKGKGKLKKPQEGGFAFGPYTQGLSGIEKKRRPLQKGGKLRRIPNWECYKG